MVPNVLPNWARLALSIATLLSYVPQYHRLREQGHSDGLSLCYVAFSLASATEHLTVGVLLNFGSPREDAFVEDPATAGDWFNLGQLGAVWLCSLVLFVLYLVYSRRRDAWVFAWTVYALYLFVSIIPAVLLAIYPSPRQTRDLFLLAHSLILLPTSTALLIFGAATQTREITRRRRFGPDGLSLPGLVAQAVVFALVAISWVFRVQYPPYAPSWDGWYRLVGWPVVGNGTFALIQGVLVWVAIRLPEEAEEGELESRPLLQG
ncbi:pq loop repeat protein [Colletotrichum plurivorum]|uniref:Pq loop repeat protein n=1 Tax=Colletotrichum plurivorum TaxID=2175906 RepID=A0A8H6JQ30_9PEZI|nr:pq loop repeat protein [Colletotrichum plurivorum]